ncbi:hypothetical protein GIB67_023007 [Kingdonia uniflora]|uniref:Aminotransferase class I/classII large domain-containing protein n=1 Tax=Kingdonia uniflora TaxID=39325 RepID=A0A7J7P3A2_9MAGN|nr:hypothetical protein GIB67_023007 [Kingdonia uniflora]
MEGMLSKVAQTLKPSPIQELSHLAQRCNAINLAEGFPDFPARLHIKQAAISAINSDYNQYRHVQGMCDLLAKKMEQEHGLNVDPITDIAICCGQTEAFAATIFASGYYLSFLVKLFVHCLGILGFWDFLLISFGELGSCYFFTFSLCCCCEIVIDPGDEVILFDPVYETYETCITLAGGIPVYVTLDPPHWTLDLDKFIKSFTVRTKVVVLNRTHFPTLEDAHAYCLSNQCRRSPMPPISGIPLETSAMAICYAYPAPPSVPSQTSHTSSPSLSPLPMASGNSRPSRKKYDYCGKWGHLKSTCHALHGRPAGYQPLPSQSSAHLSVDSSVPDSLAFSALSG